MAKEAFDQQTAEDEFHLAYGAALAAWTRMEHALSDLFSRVAGMHPTVGSAVYFGINSFGARRKAFEKAVRVSAVPEPVRNLLLKIATRLKNWQETRNALAHDVPLPDRRPSSKTAGQMLIVSGEARWRSEEDRAQFFDRALTLADLWSARSLFAETGGLIQKLAWDEDWPHAEQLEQLVQRILELPSHVQSRPSPHTSRPERPH